jgi:hypothetical protein
VAAVAVGPWELGWNALVAIGTLALAFGTGGLAVMTWRLARSAAAEARSQARPALIPGRGGNVLEAISQARLEYRPEQQHLVVNIRNAGRGPALFVRVALEPSGNSPSSGPLAAMAPGDEVQLVFAGESAQRDRWQVLLDYRDLGGRTYSTAILIESTPTLRFYDVRTFEDRVITPHGDAAPQDGVTDLTK